MLEELQKRRPQNLFAQNSKFAALVKYAEGGSLWDMLEIYKYYCAGLYIPANGYRAISWFRKIETLVDAGELFFAIGWIYFSGDGLNKDLGKAVWWFNKSAEQGNSEAKYMLGEIYLRARKTSETNWFVRDDEIVQNLQAAFDWFSECSWNCRYYVLRKISAYGIGAVTDINECEFFLESVKYPDNSQKMYELGKKYFYGEKNRAQGIYWLECAAQNFNDYAIVELGKIYLDFGEVDLAAWWLNKIIDAGKFDADLFYIVAETYHYPIRGDRNLDAAIYWYEKAAEIGSAESNWELVDIYYYAKKLPRNEKLSVYLKRAEEYFREHYDGDDDEYANSMRTILAWMYRYVEKNMEKAVQYYEDVIFYGNIEDYNGIVITLAKIYRDGEGVPQNGKRAAELLCGRAFSDGYYPGFEYEYPATYAIGSDEARYILGCMYLYGKAVKKNIRKAEHWFELVDELEYYDDGAIFDMAEAYRKGEGVEQDAETAITWYNWLIEYRDDYDGEISCIIGEIYYKGDGVEKDIDSAVEWYEKAADCGNEKAMGRLWKIEHYD